MPDDRPISSMTLSDFRAWLTLRGDHHPQPGPVQLLQNESDILCTNSSAAFRDWLHWFELELSPITLAVNESWCPYLDFLCKKYGYSFTWERDKEEIPDLGVAFGKARLVKNP